MVKLRKILAVVYLASFVLATSLLALYWFGIDPVASFMGRARGDSWMDYILWVTIGISTIGTLGYTVRTLMQRGKNTFQKSSNELGSVQISRAALVREVNNVLDSHPELKKQKVEVTIKNRRHPYANVAVRIAPRGSYNMHNVAEGLQREIKEALERLSGNEVRSVVVDIRKQSGDGDVAVPAASQAAEAAEARAEDASESLPQAGGEGDREPLPEPAEAMAEDAEQIELGVAEEAADDGK